MAAYARLFGRPRLRVDGHRFEPPPGKDAALLVYLVWHGGWTERGRLAGLVWGDRPEEIARRNLRQALFRLRHGPWASVLEVEPRRVRALAASDVAAFRDAVRGQAWDEALRLRTGPFLAEWSLDDLPELDAWRDEVRSELDRLWRHALEARARELEGAGDLLEAAHLWGHAWRDDVLDEAAIARQSDLLRRAEREGEALREVRAHAEAFARTVGVAPSPSAPSVAPRAGDTPPPLPTAATPFVGRATERAALRTLLDADAVRLATIVGIGGAGKTRLATEVARSVADGGGTVRWVALEALDDPADVPGALGRAWNPATTEAATVAEVADAIGRGRALLVLDNVEHQLEAVREAATILLQRCPRLTILTTSRALLGLQAEHPVPLAGLALGPDDDGDDHDAARLFLTAARRRRPDLAIDERSHVVQELCRDVGGLPLALELLASWSDVLSPDAMLAELRRGLDVLSSAAPDLPQRHRALRVVLAASHEQLGGDGREAFAKLTPFRGGFDLAAAREVGVTPRGLQELVRAMLVQREGGRFAHHPLVRRFALERAGADPAAFAERRRRHADVYLGRLAELVPALLRQSGLASARRTYLDDGPNLREALLWASEHADVATFVRRHQAFVILEWTFVRRHDAAFAEEALRRASVPIRPHLRQVLVDVRLDANDRSGPARESLEREARSLVAEGRARGDGLLASRALRSLARSRLRAGDAGAAETYATEAVRALRHDGARWGWVAHGAVAYGFRARSAARAAAGRYVPARRDLLRAIALFRRMGDPGLPELSRLLQLDVAFGFYARAARVADAVDACLPEEAPATARLRRHLDRARLHLARGEPAPARTVAAAARAEAEVLLGELRRRRLASVEGLLAHAALLDGADDRAADHLARAGDAPVQDARRAHLALRRGRADEALATARRALAALRDGRGVGFVAGFARSLEALALSDAGFADEAIARTGRHLAWARRSARAPELLRAAVSVVRLAAPLDAMRAEGLARAVARHPAADGTTRRLLRDVRAREPADGSRDAAEIAALVDRAEAALARLSSDAPTTARPPR